MPFLQYDAERNNRINKIINEKSKKAMIDLVAEMRKLGMKHDASNPLTAVKNRFSKTDGLINRIRFGFKRSGVFVHKGVGRGTPISKAGTTSRRAKPWFNNVIDKYADEIMEECADEWVDIIIDKLRLK